MGRKFKKAAAALLTAAMFLQQCNVVSLAEADPTEISAEAEAAAAEAEAAAQAEAEAQAAAEAEAAAQAEAEAQAAAAEAEAAAQAEAEAAAAAEAAAQAEAEAAAQAEAEAQAAAEAAAQSEAEAAAQAEAEAAAQAEAEAAAQAEAEAAAQAEAEAAAAAEAETEQPARSSRVNAGAQIIKDDLTAMLGNILPYLFVAETVTFPEIQTEEGLESEQESTQEEDTQVPETWILEGDPAAAELAAQAWNALTLADAQSTEEVTVINLYYDEFGTLDITQLYNIFEDQILDVSNDRYYVVNVIADSPEQVLDFYGFDLSENGFYLYYTKSTQPCSVLYNFAAMDGETYTDYRGTLRLWGDLQGTVLAPAANVEVEQNLAGAVYAQSISVISPEAQLQRNIYIEGEPEVIEEPAPETEAPVPETEAPEPETEAATEAPVAETVETEAPAPETEVPAPEPETEAATEVVTVAPETEAVTEAPAEEPEVIEEPAPETEALALETDTSAPETEVATEVPETESETEIITETPETEIETEEPETEPETEIVTEASETEEIVTLANEPAVIDGEGKYTLKLTAEVYYNEIKLTAYEGDRSYYIGLFADEDGNDRIDDPKELVIKDGETEGEVSFENLSAGEYYIYEVKKDGTREEDSDFTIEKMPIEVEEKGDELLDDTITETVKLIFNIYPEGEFSYNVKVPVEIVVTGHDDEELKVTEEFEVGLYTVDDKEEGTKKFELENKAKKTEEISLTLSSASQQYYVKETTGKNFAYTPSYSPEEFEVSCGDVFDKDSPVETIKNKLNDTITYISIANTSGKLINGATYVILDSSFQRITDKLTIGEKPDEYKNTANETSKLKDNETYYLYQMDAPDGYTPGTYKKFTVKAGLTNEVVIEDEVTEETNSTIVITKYVYVDDYAVYATSSAAPYYFALFENSGCTEKVSNVKTVTVTGTTIGSRGTGTFENVEPGKTYYVAETDEYGIALSGSDPKVTYTPGNEVTVTANTNHQITVLNTWSDLPYGYNYIGRLTLTKEVTNSSGSPVNATDTFYIGLYKNADYSGTPQVITLSLNNASSAYATNTFRLEDGSLTYYVTEVTKDSNGSWVPVSEDSEFPYKSSVSQSSVTITKDSINNNIPNVTVTNISSASVELYLTKRVYEGSETHETSDTFYAGLFKDEALTELYTSPIEMKMAGRENGELTQKLTMSVSATKETTIYVAEVNANGTPVTESQYESFGYEIGSNQPIPVTFSPSEGKDQMRAVILNGVYGTMTDEDWDSIYDDIEDLYGDDDEIGLADDLEEEESSVQTADNTPVAGTVALMAAALIVLGYSIRRRRRVS